MYFRTAKIQYTALLKYAFYSILLSLLINSAVAQQNAYTVIAPSGLNVRAQPNLESRIVFRLSFLDTIENVSERLNEQIIDEVAGYWRMVTLRHGLKGYCWDGFLRPLDEEISASDVFEKMPQLMDTIAEATEEITESFERLPLPSPKESAKDTASLSADSTFSQENKTKIEERELTFQDTLIEPDYVHDSALEIIVPDSQSVTNFPDSLTVALVEVERSADTLIRIALVDSNEIYEQDTVNNDQIDEVVAAEKISIEVDSSSADNPPSKSDPANIDAQLLLETYNFCGDASSINLNLNWWSFVPEGEFIFPKKTDVQILLSRNKLGEGYEFDIVSDLEARSMFMLGFTDASKKLPLKLPNPEFMLRQTGRKILPGKSLNLGQSTKIYALGNVTGFSGECPQIDNYKLLVQFADEPVFDLLSLLPKSEDCSIPDLYFYGDLSGDSRPEFIFVYNGENENTFYILWSVHLSNEYRVASVFTMKNCN
ncbi:MAG: SH3 domain-containing protein [Flavobacteriales bacterium]|nr:MAG: SH3 domain-containing protein [Flavobacteriales bacterium]